MTIKAGAMRPLLAAVAAALLLVTAGCSGGDQEGTLAGFAQPTGGALELQRVVQTRPGDELRQAEVLQESAEAIKVRVVVRPREGAGPDLAQFQHVTVTLSEPLGSRDVQDQDGKDLPVVES